MGIRGLWDLVSPAARNRSFKELAIDEGFTCDRHSLRTITVGIDAAIWLSQARTAFVVGHAQAGENPELRMIFFKLVRLLQSPVTPLFVFDGPGRPIKKRGVNVITRPEWLTAPLQEMLDAFHFQHYTAPGEAEAELAQLNQAQIIDTVMTEDSDVLVFGATQVIRDWTATNDAIRVYTAKSIVEHKGVRLTRGGMLLIALLSGNDYNPSGIAKIGPKIAQKLAHAGLGDSLLSAVINLPVGELKNFLSTWRQNLRKALSKRRSLLNSIPDDFPTLEHLRFLTLPKTSFSEGTARPDPSLLRPRPPDIAQLARLCNRRFGWDHGGWLLRSFRKHLWGGVCFQVACYEDIWTRFLDDFPLKQSAIIRIRRTKLGSGPSSGLEYLVDFSAVSLISIIKSCFEITPEDQTPNDSVCSTWIPSPVLSRCLPQMVAERQRTSHKLHAKASTSTCRSDSERIFATPIIDLSTDSDSDDISLIDVTDIYASDM